MPVEASNTTAAVTPDLMHVDRDRGKQQPNGEQQEAHEQTAAGRPNDKHMGAGVHSCPLFLDSYEGSYATRTVLVISAYCKCLGDYLNLHVLMLSISM